MTSPSPLSATTRTQLAEGIALFNQGRFWEAHEAWEDAWLAEEGPTKLFLQGLIQLTAAFHKGLRMDHRPGMARLFEQAAEKFEHMRANSAAIGGLNLDDLLFLAREGRAAALSGWPTGHDPWEGNPPTLRLRAEFEE